MNGAAGLRRCWNAEKPEMEMEMERMKVLFFSDVHGSPESLRLLLRRAEEWKPDLFVLLGDVLYHGPRNPLRPDYAPQEAAGLLNPLRDRILAVRGNCDAEVDQLLLEFPVMSDSSLLFLRQILLFQCDLPEVFLSFFQDNTFSLEFFSGNQIFDICNFFSVNGYASLFNSSSGL